jgi:hypothetical protein
VDDADARRDDLEGVEGLHAPLEELVALAVALEFEIEVLREGVGAAGEIHLHGVVDHEVNRHERLDDLRVLAQLGHGRAHGGEVDEQRHAGEVLQHDARDDEGDLRGAGLGGLPVGEFLDVGLEHALAVAVAQHGLEHEADAHRQAGDARELLGQLGQRVEFLAALEGLEGVEGIREIAHGRLELAAEAWLDHARARRRRAPTGVIWPARP